MKQKEKLESLGKKILNLSRTDILLNLPYLNTALLSLDYVMDLTTTSVGTDAFSIRFNPGYLFRLYQDAPVMVNRTYMHMLMHCLFRHVFSTTRFSDERLFNLACDIAAEHILDSMDEPAIHRPLSDLREDIYKTLEKEISVLTAERIYRYLKSIKDEESAAESISLIDTPNVSTQNRTYNSHADTKSSLSQDNRALQADSLTDTPVHSPDNQTLSSYDYIQFIGKWEKAFLADDHSFWRREREDGDVAPPENEVPKLPLPLMNVQMRQVKEEEWDRISRRVQSEIDLLSGHNSGESGTFSWMLSLQNERYQDFRQYLARFAVVREEIGIDPDTFDYALYNYGFEVYGNMPLIEENELRTTKRVASLVIAIDTSASCKERLVKKFLSQTAAIFKSQETFFHHMELCILECDNVIQNETFITDLRDIDNYTESFTAHGGYGTDFRPVFDRVWQLQTEGRLTNLRGLLYFTDGFGTFPQRVNGGRHVATHTIHAPMHGLSRSAGVTPYETAFVFYKDAPYNDKDVPAWAVKLFFSEIS